MGYKLRDIAEIQEPSALSVAGATNFVVFGSKTTEGTPAEMEVVVRRVPTTPLVFTDAEGEAHTFTATTDPERVGGYTFFAEADLTRTAQNIRRAMLADAWVAANFEVSVPVVWVGGVATPGTTIRIVSRGCGREYGFSVDFLGLRQTAESTSGDSLKGEEEAVEIELDIHTDLGAPIGSDDRGYYLGKFAVTLQKTYAGEPVWFDLNQLFRATPDFKPPTRCGWFDPGTMRDFRFMARRTSHTSEVFYESGALRVLIGAGKRGNMTPYIVGEEGGRLLTKKPRTPYVKGGEAFINFIRGVESGRVRIRYEAYSMGGKCLGVTYSGEAELGELQNINSKMLALDSIIELFPTVARVRVALERDRRAVSDFLEFDILPEELHEPNCLSFIGDFGQWEAVNLGAVGKSDIKPTYTYYDRTVTPESEARERTYAVECPETMTVQTAPMTDEAAKWLRELARAKLVVDKGLRVVLVTEFALAIDPENKNMQRATIKYRYADERTLY